jgi:hypothetical protein
MRLSAAKVFDVALKLFLVLSVPFGGFVLSTLRSIEIGQERMLGETRTVQAEMRGEIRTVLHRLAALELLEARISTLEIRAERVEASTTSAKDGAALLAAIASLRRDAVLAESDRVDLHRRLELLEERVRMVEKK